MLLRSLGSFTTLRVATLLRSLVWVGVGVGWGGGGMLTFLVLRTGYIAMLLRSLGSWVTCCYAAGISGIVLLCGCYAADGVGWGGVGGAC